MSDNDEKRQIFTSRMEKYHGKNAKKARKSRVRADREPAFEEKVPEAPAEAPVPEEKKELKFDLYEKVSRTHVEDAPEAPAAAEPELRETVFAAAPVSEPVEIPRQVSVPEDIPEEPAAGMPAFEAPEVPAAVPEEPEMPEAAPEMPAGISRFPSEDAVIDIPEDIPESEPEIPREPEVKIEEDINKYRQNVAAVAAPIFGGAAETKAEDDIDDISLTPRPDEKPAEKAADLKAETAEEPEPVFEDDAEEAPSKADRKAEKKAEKERLKAEKLKEKEEKKAGKKKVSRTAKTWIIALIVVALVIAFLLLFVFEIVSVEGRSMEPTLNGGEKVVVDKVSRYFEYPQRGTIVITKYDGYDGYYIKRVIAYPGEWVEVYDNTIYLNGEPLDEPYASEGEINDMELQQVPEGCYFLVGDNRSQSLDSRQETIGCVKQENLIGNAWAVIWPFDNIHLVK